MTKKIKISADGAEILIHVRRFLREYGRSELEKEARLRGRPPEDIQEVFGR